MNGTTIHIFDVEHGECNHIESPTGRTVMIGAGHNSTTGWRPSNYLLGMGSNLTCFVVSNLDRDHLSDLTNFEPVLRPQALAANQYIEPDWMRRKKLQESGEIHPGVATALNWMKDVFTGGGISIDYGFTIKHFFHPTSLFQDTNNLSVVTYIEYNGFGVMFPGDLEEPAWEEFLKRQDFVGCLRNTDILIAPHHGREGGYHAPVFRYCNPEIVIISDKPIVHSTQDHNLYGRHCRGIQWDDGTIRKVLTTRRHGKISIQIPPTGGYRVTTTS